MLLNDMFGRQGMHFLWVGGVSTLTHFSVLVVFIEQWRISPEFATIWAFFASLLVSYFLNRHYTFRCQQLWWQTFPRYLFVTLVGLGLNISLMYIFVSVIEISYLWGFIVVTLFVPFSNFLLNRYWTFA